MFVDGLFEREGERERERKRERERERERVSDRNSCAGRRSSACLCSCGPKGRRAFSRLRHLSRCPSLLQLLAAFVASLFSRTGNGRNVKWRCTLSLFLRCVAAVALCVSRCICMFAFMFPSTGGSALVRTLYSTEFAECACLRWC